MKRGTVRLLATSDLHVKHPENRAFVEQLPASPEDWLIIAGDVGEDVEDLELVLSTLSSRFAKLIWVPGNHELWTLPGDNDRPRLRGEEKYARLVDVCRARGVVTPEDPYPVWPGEGPPTVIAPMFLLYDYSFRPPDVRREDALAWALEEGIECVDEHLLRPDPHPSREAWCAARVAWTEQRLDGLGPDVSTVLVNHFPLLHSHARLPRVPRFMIWCGTKRTEAWHIRYRARAVVYGHLHIPRTHHDDGVPFEEVSLGYPHQSWGRARGLRQILPRPAGESGSRP